MASFFWSMATLMVISTVTIYHEIDLGISKKDLGSIQAYAYLVAYITKLGSGIVIDIFKNYKTLLIVGSCASMVLKPMFAFATSYTAIFYLRTSERLTKGVRAAPTDAYLTAMQEKSHRGQAFALKHVMFTMGASIGCVVASVLLYLSHNHFKMVYLCSIVPGIMATIALFFMRYTPSMLKRERKKFHWEQLTQLSPLLWWMYALVFVITLARFGETFLSHRMYEAGYAIYQIPLIYIFYDLPFALVSLCAIKIFDTVDWKKLIYIGLVLLALSNGFLFISDRGICLSIGAILAGIHMGITQGTFLTVISKYSPETIKGTSFAIYYVVFGLSMFLSNKINGILNHAFHTWKAGFISGFVIALIVLVLFAIIAKQKHFACHDTR